MKRLALAALMMAASLVAACGDDSPTAPSNQVVFTATLAAANEVPPVTNSESGGRGTATITFDVTRSTAGAISSGTVAFQFSVEGFPAGSSAILAHIHTGASTVAGPVLVNTGLSAATAVALPNGSGTFSVSGISVDAAT